MKTLLVVAAALVDSDKRILLAQRPPGKAMAGLWEFPGGKVEPGELPEDALIRELGEELGIEVCHACLLPGPFISHSYRNTPPQADPDCNGCPTGNAPFIPARELGVKEEFHLLMPLYICRNWEGIALPLDGQNLAWRTLAQMETLPMPPADRPLLAALRVLL